MLQLMITDGSRTLLNSPLQDYSLELSLSNNNKSTIVHLAILYVVNRWDGSTQICRSSSSISIGWGSSIAIGWGTYCMNIGLSWNLDIHIWLSSNLLMNIRLSSNLNINVWLSSNFLMDIRLSSNLFINIWLSRNLNINVGLSQGIQVAISYRGIICSSRSVSSSGIRGSCIIRSSSSACNQTGKGNNQGVHDESE